MVLQRSEIFTEARQKLLDFRFRNHDKKLCSTVLLIIEDSYL